VASDGIQRPLLVGQFVLQHIADADLGISNLHYIKPGNGGRRIIVQLMYRSWCASPVKQLARVQEGKAGVLQQNPILGV